MTITVPDLNDYDREFYAHNRKIRKHSRDNIDRFAKTYYASNVQGITFWMGRHITKHPSDVWTVQEIIWETKPELIVETGVFHGGSALFYAHLLDILGDGQVVSIDVAYDTDFDYPNHPRIELLLGISSIDPAAVEAVAKRAQGKRTMVILDSNHECDHVLQELRLYSRFVTKGCYMIVEDTNPLGYRLCQIHQGPAEALQAWQPNRHGFEVDRDREKHLMTFHPGGFLKRIR